MGLWAWGRMVPRGPSGRALVSSVSVAVQVCVGGPSDGACLGPLLAGLLGCGAG